MKSKVMKTFAHSDTIIINDIYFIDLFHSLMLIFLKLEAIMYYDFVLAIFIIYYI